MNPLILFKIACIRKGSRKKRLFHLGIQIKRESKIICWSSCLPFWWFNLPWRSLSKDKSRYKHTWNWKSQCIQSFCCSGQGFKFVQYNVIALLCSCKSLIGSKNFASTENELAYLYGHIFFIILHWSFCSVPKWQWQFPVCDFMINKKKNRDYSSGLYINRYHKSCMNSELDIPSLSI